MAADTPVILRHRFNPTILRSYDIRGQVGHTLSAEDAFFIGATFGHLVREKKGPHIAVGRDGRLTSPELAAALIDGLEAVGCRVSDIGVGPTPMLYFADRFLECDGAIQVTGSHNPPDHNGFKLVYDHRSFFGEDIQKIGALSEQGVARQTGGSQQAVSVFDAYIDRILQAADFGSFHIIWDAGNGAAGPAIDALIAKASGQHKALFTDIDGRFPNHHPNPVDPKTLEILRAEVHQAGADCGIGFDGDGDRIGVIDSKGRQIAGDILTAYLGLEILERHPGSDIIFDVKSSNAAMDIIKRAGGQAHIWKTGHSHMKTRLREMHAPLAGEMSGHIFIADDYFGFDDALFVAVRLISCMVRQKRKTGQSLTDFMDKLPPSFTTPECHIACADTVKFGVIEQLAQQIQALYPVEQINLTDGVRVTTDKGWCLIRASNTEGALVARAEGADEASRNDLIAMMQAQLETAGLKWDGP